GVQYLTRAVNSWVIIFSGAGLKVMVPRGEIVRVPMALKL
ncbi:MAG: hypothetical protein Hyperionvirus31_22, partial [Hyperionvirus sp.]